MARRANQQRTTALALASIGLGLAYWMLPTGTLRPMQLRVDGSRLLRVGLPLLGFAQSTVGQLLPEVQPTVAPAST